jgi:hypothetical protein
MNFSKDEIQSLVAQFGGRAWAHMLKIRHERGDAINRNQVRCYRNALNLNIQAQ